MNNSKKIKIGVFIDGEFIPSYSGATNRFHYLSRYLESHTSIEVVVILGDRGWVDYQKIDKEPFKTYVLNYKDFYEDRNRIIDILKKEKVDFVQFDSVEQVLLQGYFIKKSLNIPVILEAHYDFTEFTKMTTDSNDKVELKNHYYSLGKQIVDGLICLTEDEKGNFVDFFDLPESLVGVIPTGVDLSEIKPNQVDFNSKKIVFLGNNYFHPNEVGVRFIYNEIYSKLKNKGYKFVVGGDAPKALVKDLGSESFQFVGQVPDLNDLFDGALCALVPIFHDPGMRLKILNFAAAGLPILTTKEGAKGFPDLSKLDIIASSDFVGNIQRIKENQAYWQSRADGLYSFLKEELEWSKIAKKTERYYQNAKTEIEIKQSNINLQELKIFEPSWLEEVVRKGRFKINENATPRGVINEYGKK